MHCRAAPALDAAIIDLGGGYSTLADDLLAAGCARLTVLAISATALDASRRRLGAACEDVNWPAADVLKANLPTATFDIWHYCTVSSLDSRHAGVAALNLLSGITMPVSRRKLAAFLAVTGHWSRRSNASQLLVLARPLKHVSCLDLEFAALAAAVVGQVLAYAVVTRSVATIAGQSTKYASMLASNSVP